MISKKRIRAESRLDFANWVSGNESLWRNTMWCFRLSFFYYHFFGVNESTKSGRDKYICNFIGSDYVVDNSVQFWKKFENRERGSNELKSNCCTELVIYLANPLKLWICRLCATTFVIIYKTRSLALKPKLIHTFNFQTLSIPINLRHWHFNNIVKVPFHMRFSLPIIKSIPHMQF